MDIFESLENLNVSEECFEEIMDMVEELLSEDIYHTIDKHAPEKDKQRLMNKAYDNQQKELYSAAKREERPEDVKILTQEWDGKKVDDGIHKSANRILDRRSPNTKQAENIMSKGTAKAVAGETLKNKVEKDMKSNRPSGTSYADKEKLALSKKLIKQGDKEFKQGVDQLQDLRYPLTIEYKDGKRQVSLRKKNK